MKTKIIRACDMIAIPRKLLLDPKLSLTAKGVAGALLTFNDCDYCIAELSEETGASVNDLLYGLRELLTHGYIDYRDNTYILKEVL